MHPRGPAPSELALVHAPCCRGALGGALVLLRVRSPSFEEEEHFRVLVKMAAQELSNGIPDSGHLYASIRASRTLTPAGDLQETFSGMDQVTS